jgi:hypothetical protein
MSLLGDYAYVYGYDYELRSSWNSVMSGCVARNKKNPDVSKERNASEVLEGTYQPLKMKALRFFETSGYVQLPATQRNIPEEQDV